MEEKTNNSSQNQGKRIAMFTPHADPLAPRKRRPEYLYKIASDRA